MNLLWKKRKSNDNVGVCKKTENVMPTKVTVAQDIKKLNKLLKAPF